MPGVVQYYVNSIPHYNIASGLVFCMTSSFIAPRPHTHMPLSQDSSYQVSKQICPKSRTNLWWWWPFTYCIAWRVKNDNSVCKMEKINGYCIALLLQQCWLADSLYSRPPPPKKKKLTYILCSDPLRRKMQEKSIFLVLRMYFSRNYKGIVHFLIKT